MSSNAHRSDSFGHVHLARGASYLVLQTLGSALVYIFAFVVLARIISTREMGILTILQLVNATCLIFGTFSVQQGVTKFVSENSTRSSRNVAAAVYYQALRFTLLTSILIGGGIFVGAWYLAVHLLGSSSYVIVIQVVAVDTFLDTGAIPVVTGALLGLQMFRETAIIGFVVTGIVRQVMIIGLILMLHGFVGLVYGWLLSDGLTVAVCFILLLRVLGVPRFDFPLGKLLHYSYPLMLGNIAGYAQTWFDRAILVLFVPIAALGIYNAAWTAFSVLLGISSALGSVLFPAYSSLQEMADPQKSREAIRLAVRYSNFILLPLALGMVAVASPALTLFVGRSYASGAVPLMIFSGAFAVANIGITALSPVLWAREKTFLSAMITIVSVIIGLGAAYFLLPSLGIVGASAARALAMVILAALTIIAADRGVSVRFQLKTILKTILASLAMLASIFALELVRYAPILLPVYVAIGALVYVLMLRVVKAVNRNDVVLVRDFLGERFAFVSNLLSLLLSPDRR